MPSCFTPRLSQAKALLPTIRAELAAAAVHHSIPAGLSIELLPIVEDGLVGYELLPDSGANTYVSIGCDETGVPVLRESSFRPGAPRVLRVASVDGRSFLQSELDDAHRLRRCETLLADWRSAADAAWTAIAALFPQHPRHGIEVHDARHECLDEAISIACAHLAGWDPCIDFCGVPNEAQYGFALTHVDGGHGQLVCRQPGRWALWFQSQATALRREWTIATPGVDATETWVRASANPRHAPQTVAMVIPTLPTASQRRPRKARLEDRRSGDRRHADRRKSERHYEERRRADRRRVERRHEP
jgi:hypothetical protein